MLNNIAVWTRCDTIKPKWVHRLTQRGFLGIWNVVSTCLCRVDTPFLYFLTVAFKETYMTTIFVAPSSTLPNLCTHKLMMWERISHRISHGISTCDEATEPEVSVRWLLNLWRFWFTHPTTPKNRSTSEIIANEPASPLLIEAPLGKHKRKKGREIYIEFRNIYWWMYQYAHWGISIEVCFKYVKYDSSMSESMWHVF